MRQAEAIAQIREKYRSLQPEMDERLRVTVHSVECLPREG
jgi:hypothetical protein